MECEKVEQERKINRFLMKSKDMYDAIEYITNRGDKVAPNIHLDDMPREV